MKLHKLEIKNIASLVEATIDFSSPELSSEPIFLISGNIGSGKTTILNAICIALYNQVPALDEAPKEEDDHSVRVNSPLQLVRRHCKEASISLGFSDKEDVFYTIEWHATRITRGKNKGGFNPIKRMLSIRRKGQQPQYFTGIKEINDNVRAIVGLTFEQFCRTTMLAQGQFLKFIDSDNRHKSDILEKITGTEIYSQVGAQIYAITKERRDRYAALENQIKGANLLSDDDKRQLTDEVDSLTKGIDSKSRRCEELEKQVKWLDDYAQCVSKIKDAADLLANAEAKAPEINALRQTVADWDATAEMRAILKGQLDANNAFADVNQRVKSLEPKYIALEEGAAYLDMAVKDCQRQMADNQEALDKEKPYEELFASMGQILAWIRQVEEANAKIEQCEQLISLANRELQTAIANRDREQKAVDEAQKRHDKQQAVADSLAIQAEGIDIKALGLKKEAAKKQDDFVKNAISAFADLQSELAKLKEIEDEAAKAEVDLKTNNELYARAISDKDRLLVEKNDADSRLSGQMDLMDKLAQLTHIFKDTHACPLCGAEVEHLHTKDFIDAAVAEAQIVADKARTDFEAAQDKANDLASSVKSLQSSLIKANDESEKQKAKVGKLRTAFEAFGIYSDRLEAEQAEANAQYASASQALETAYAQIDALALATKELASRRKALDAALAKLEAAKVKVANIEGDINKNKALISSRNDDKSAVLLDLKAKLQASAHPELPMISAEADLRAIKDALPRIKSKYDRLLDLSRALADRLRTLVDTHQRVGEDLKLLSDTYAKPSIAGEPREYPDIAVEANLFSAEVVKLNGQIIAIKDTIDKLARKEAEYCENHPKEETLTIIDRLGPATEADIANCRESARAYDLRVENLKGSLGQLRKNMEEISVRRPASLAEEQTLQLAMADKDALKAEIEELKQKKASAAALLEQNEKNEKENAQRKIDYEKAKAEYIKWDKLNKKLGKENGEEFRKIAQAYIFGLLLRSANKYLSQLTSRYTLDGVVGSLIIYVIDHHDGNNKRVAKALSGGEGFMASLALALALSTINQELDPLDILFIDEGFGALDPSARESTIDMLCSLSRRVCIISHMPELRECIPTQIVVSRQPGTSRSSVQISSR